MATHIIPKITLNDGVTIPQQGRRSRDRRRLADTAALVQQALSANGLLDDAFNNAGIHGIRADTADVETSDVGHIIAVNLRGTFPNLVNTRPLASPGSIEARGRVPLRNRETQAIAQPFPVDCTAGSGAPGPAGGRVCCTCMNEAEGTLSCGKLGARQRCAGWSAAP